ncbi:hypothetical protein [Paracoccus sp. (in: a-proteobacteria)]|uniref:hypothetical protein n=1 Tax=Paracoccus sp. TaxID=267 RepID=UPI003A86A6BC
MPQIDGIISLLDSRSFGTIWYWVVLIGMWSAAGRNVIGIPTEVLSRARYARNSQPEGVAVMNLLDWLSLVLPRWHLRRQEGAVFLAVSAFLLTSLAIMGFRHDLEMAQALTLLLLPFAILYWLRVLLARRLLPLVMRAQDGDLPVTELAAQVIRRLTWHRRAVTLLSVVSVATTGIWGAIWSLLHPNGL